MRQLSAQVWGFCLPALGVQALGFRVEGGSGFRAAFQAGLLQKGLSFAGWSLGFPWLGSPKPQTLSPSRIDPL